MMNDVDCVWEAKSLKELFEIWKQKSSSGAINHAKNFFIEDGVVNYKVWNQGEKKRILYVLKEAYGGDWDENSLTLWLAKQHPKLRMWSRVARLTHGIQNTSMMKICKYKPELIEEEHIDAVNQIAVLNLKKSNGESRSNHDEITQYAAYDREEIRREFELIDADIVICGSTFKTFCKNVFPDELNDCVKCDNWYYYKNVGGKKRLFIDFYHPANHWPDLYNYYALVNIYQQALLEEQ